MIAHAGLVAARIGGRWRGVLIEGPSGAGKSDLALRALSGGFRLVADDRTILFVSAGRLFGRAPDALRGRIEVRGVGVMSVPPLPFAEVRLIVRCVESGAALERLPDRRYHTVLDIEVPAIDLWPAEPSAVSKMSRALDWLGAFRQEAYQAAGT
ncbi:MAG: HPr kinase/phosphorylase [Caulobacteraceae bacterium]